MKPFGTELMHDCKKETRYSKKKLFFLDTSLGIISIEKKTYFWDPVLYLDWDFIQKGPGCISFEVK